MRSVLTAIFLIVFPFLVFGQEQDELEIQGNKLIEAGKYKDAVKHFSNAIQKDDQKPVYFYKRAVAYQSSKETQLAHDDFTKAISLDNSYSLAYYERARLFNGAKMYQSAINDLDMALKYAPNDSMRFRTLLFRSGLRLSVRNFKGAYEDSRAFFDHDTTSHDALINMALSKLELNENEVAINYLQKIIDVSPNDTMCLLDMGFVNLKMERYDSALYYLNRTCTLDPKNAYALSNLSYTKLKLGHPRDALKDVNESLRYSPDNSYAFRNRALIYLQIFETEKACLDLKSAIKKGFTDQYGTEVQDLFDDNCKKK